MRTGYLLLLLLTIAAMVPLSTDVYGLRIYTPYILFSLVLLLLAAVWVLRPGVVSLRREEVALVVAALLALVFSSASVNPGKALDGALVLVYASIVYLAVRYWLSVGMLLREEIMRVSRVAFMLLTIVALLQIVLQKNIGVVSTYFGVSSTGGTYADYGGTRLRISGPFGNANVFSQVYSLYGSVVVAGLLFARSDAGRAVWAMITTTLLVLVVVLSLSRSGIAGAVLMQAAIYLYWIRSEKSKAAARFGILATPFLVLVFVSAAVYFVIPQDIEPAGLSRLMDSSGGGRLALVDGVRQLMQEPEVALFGVGSGQFFSGIEEYNIYLPYKEWKNIGDLSSSVHNWTLQIAVENGLVVLILYVYALVKTIVRGWSVRKAPFGWVAASLGLIVAVLYAVPLQLTTAGVTPWLLTPVSVMLAWIQHEYDAARGAVRGEW